jgi:hypothetical protein
MTRDKRRLTLSSPFQMSVIYAKSKLPNLKRLRPRHTRFSHVRHPHRGRPRQVTKILTPECNHLPLANSRIRKKLRPRHTQVFAALLRFEFTFDPSSVR